MRGEGYTEEQWNYSGGGGGGYKATQKGGGAEQEEEAYTGRGENSTEPRGLHRRQEGPPGGVRAPQKSEGMHRIRVAT